MDLKSRFVVELEKCGWAFIECGCNSESILQIARLIGTPICSPNGELVRCLMPSPQHLGDPKTFTGKHGCGEFPLHTDTAFWARPARFLVLHASGDIRRATTLLSWQTLLERFSLEQIAEFRASVWRVSTRAPQFYATSEFILDGKKGFRYDPNVLFPANNAAKKTDSLLQNLIADASPISISWTSESVLIIDNWRMLHGRGRCPRNEARRELFRVYVR